MPSGSCRLGPEEIGPPLGPGTPTPTNLPPGSRGPALSRLLPGDSLQLGPQPPPPPCPRSPAPSPAPPPPGPRSPHLLHARVQIPRSIMTWTQESQFPAPTPLSPKSLGLEPPPNSDQKSEPSYSLTSPSPWRLGTHSISGAYWLRIPPPPLRPHGLCPSPSQNVQPGRGAWSRSGSLTLSPSVPLPGSLPLCLCLPVSPASSPPLLFRSLRLHYLCLWVSKSLCFLFSVSLSLCWIFLALLSLLCSAFHHPAFLCLLVSVRPSPLLCVSHLRLLLSLFPALSLCL